MWLLLSRSFKCQHYQTVTPGPSKDKGMLSTKEKRDKAFGAHPLDLTKTQGLISVSRSKIDCLHLKAAENISTVISFLVILQTTLSTSEKQHPYLLWNHLGTTTLNDIWEKTCFSRAIEAIKKDKSYPEVLSLAHYAFNRRLHKTTTNPFHWKLKPKHIDLPLPFFFYSTWYHTLKAQILNKRSGSHTQQWDTLCSPSYLSRKK